MVYNSAACQTAPVAEPAIPAVICQPSHETPSQPDRHMPTDITTRCQPINTLSTQSQRVWEALEPWTHPRESLRVSPDLGPTSCPPRSPSQSQREQFAVCRSLRPCCAVLASCVPALSTISACLELTRTSPSDACWSVLLRSIGDFTELHCFSER